MVVEVPAPDATPKAATMGVGRFVLLEPNVQKYVLELDAPSLDDSRSHLRRVHDALVDEGSRSSHTASVLPRLPAASTRRRPTVTATVVGDHLVDVEPGDTRERLFGISLDVGTTTVVATLIDLRSGAAAAVESTINRQAPFGADVIARMGHAMHGPRRCEQLRAAIVATSNGLVESVCATAGVARHDVYELVAVGNATMLHLLLGVDPRSIGSSPFVATFLEPQDLRAPTRARDPSRGPGRAVPVDRRLRRRRHRGRHASRPASRATRSAACSSTSARTARSCSATPTGSSRRPPPPARRSRADRSCTACAPPKARSRAWSSTCRSGRALQVIGGDVEPRGPLRHRR